MHACVAHHGGYPWWKSFVNSPPAYKPEHTHPPRQVQFYGFRIYDTELQIYNSRPTCTPLSFIFTVPGEFRRSKSLFAKKSFITIFRTGKREVMVTMK